MPNFNSSDSRLFSANDMLGTSNGIRRIFSGVFDRITESGPMLNCVTSCGKASGASTLFCVASIISNARRAFAAYTGSTSSN